MQNLPPWLSARLKAAWSNCQRGSGNLQQGGKIANKYFDLLVVLTPNKANLLTNQPRLQIQDLIAILFKMCFISYPFGAFGS